MTIEDALYHISNVYNLAQVDSQKAEPYRIAIIALNKQIPKRVLWSGWKGIRDTRYKCPNCTKPVKNDDVYCHRCGQKLMFPKISFTPYVPGEEQELIVRWDDEE